MALTGVAELLGVLIRIIKRNTVLPVDPTIASSRIVLALVGQYHYVSLEPQEDNGPGSTDIEIPLALPSHSMKDASGLQCNTDVSRSEEKQAEDECKLQCTQAAHVIRGVWCALNGMCVHMSFCAIL